MVIPHIESVAEHPYYRLTIQHRELLKPTINQETAGHGLDHALAASDQGILIALTSPEYSHLTAEQITLVHDALILHDTGYGRVPIDATGTQMEHPGYSSIIAYQVLKDLPFYKEHPERLGQVLWLIYNHDNTNYSFPDYWYLESRNLNRRPPNISIPRLLPGALRPLPAYFDNESRLGKNNVPKDIEIDHFLVDLIQIVQEADGILSDGKRTLAFCDSRNIPRFVNEGGRSGIGDQWWQGSSAANIVLAVNRLVLDTHTESGRNYALEKYYEAFDLIRDIFKEHQTKGFLGSLDEMLAALRPDDIQTILCRNRKERWHVNLPKDTKIVLARNLIGTLRLINMINQIKFQTIASRLVTLDELRETKKSNEEGITEIEQVLELRQKLINNYALDIMTQLIGSLEVESRESDIVLGDEITSQLLIPPVVYGNQTKELKILSGGSWIEAAKELNLERVRIITPR